MFGFKKKPQLTAQDRIKIMYPNGLFPDLEQHVKEMMENRPMPEIDTLMKNYMNTRYPRK